MNVCIISTALPDDSLESISLEVSELELLCSNLKYITKKKIHQNISQINPSTYIGTGKVDEINKLAGLISAQLIVFNDEISPSQMKNIQKKLSKGIEVIDRTGIILEIFEKNAQSNEAKTQVRLASCKYMLPRLTRMWTHLERQMGGIGARAGMGETQIEVDRRLLRKEIDRLNIKLKTIENQRSVQSKGRVNAYRISLVGYTNAGKSTLMNALTGADVYIQDQLFATLDTTTKRFELKKGMDVILSDTVGFIRSLPHDLIASFKSTLMEASESDVLLKVFDASSKNILYEIEVVDSIIKELSMDDIPSIIVYNKIDLVKSSDEVIRIKSTCDEGVFVSAYRKIKLNDLNQSILNELEKDFIEIEILVPFADGKIFDYIHNNTEIISKKNNLSGTRIRLRGDVKSLSRLNNYIID